MLSLPKHLAERAFAYLNHRLLHMPSAIGLMVLGLMASLRRLVRRLDVAQPAKKPV